MKGRRQASRGRSHVRRLVFGWLFGALVLAQVAIPTEPAAADIVYDGGYGHTTASCNYINHTLDVTTTITASNGWVGASQYVAWKLWLYSYQTGTWVVASDWGVGPIPLYYGTYERHWDPPAGQYVLYSQYAWWTGAQWVMGGEFLPTYDDGQTSCYI